MKQTPHRIQSRGFAKPPERIRLRDMEREPQKLSGGFTYSSAQTLVSVPKRTYIRSKALLAAVRTLPCQITGRTDGVEPAHSNWPQHGKGKSVKADDNRVAALHCSLHREIDQGRLLSAEERQEIWWTAHCRTVRELLARGLWPKGVPVPQLEDFYA